MKDADIIYSWEINATPWIKAIQNDEIESRKLVTNQAIVNVILNDKPARVLDVGCGEGWLARSLASKGIFVLGIDAIPALIESARMQGHAQFDICSYEELLSYTFKDAVDCAVCNFSLIGEESTQGAINALSKILERNTRLVIQTLHPLIANGDVPYQDGWREGSWDGFSSDFTNPAPWYFRTIGSWCDLLFRNGFKIRNIHEPLHPQTKNPVSIIFDCYHFKGE